ncbi:MAG: hypothetical protein K8T89_06600 [Planctomycetes bacterium]|nr:hypothetical protein [Planctomycetota bacterium]
MSIHAWMLTGLLFGAPPASPAPQGEAAPSPRLEKNLEITWRGNFTEAILRPNVRAFRTYEVETRLFVIDVLEREADVAILTVIKLKPDIKTTPEPLPVTKLVLARVDAKGTLALLDPTTIAEKPEKRKLLAMPVMSMEGLPTLEPSLFVALPAATLRMSQKWDTAEDKRPAVNYRFDGFDSVRGSRTLRVLVGQQTEDWEQPVPDRPAWRRGETIWLSMKQGHAVKLERTIEKRDQESGELGFRSKLVAEHVGTMRYPERFGTDRRDEILAGARFLSEFQAMLPESGRLGSEVFEQLLQRIDQHLRGHLAGDSVPYREAIMTVKRKAEAARKGHIPPEPLPPETSEPAKILVGRTLTDVTMVELVRNESLQLSKLRGRPVLLIYYQSESARTAEPVLRFAESLYKGHGSKIYILPLAIGNSDTALKQRNEWKLSIPMLAGRDVYKQHGVDSTPCFVVLDQQGIVRHLTLGWSDENAATVQSAVEKWAK